MTTSNTFNDDILACVSPDTRKAMIAFSKAIGHAEALLRGYHDHTDTRFTGKYENTLHAIRENGRLVFTMSWAKAALFSRGVVTSMNDGNLLVAFQSLRGYVELVAALRYTMNKIAPLVHQAATTGQLTNDVATQIANHMHVLLHGGRFNWAAYFKEGAANHIDRKRVKRTQEEKHAFENNSLNRHLHQRLGQGIACSRVHLRLPLRPHPSEQRQQSDPPQREKRL